MKFWKLPGCFTYGLGTRLGLQQVLGTNSYMAYVVEITAVNLPTIELYRSGKKTLCFTVIAET